MHHERATLRVPTRGSASVVSGRGSLVPLFGGTAAATRPRAPLEWTRPALAVSSGAGGHRAFETPGCTPPAIPTAGQAQPALARTWTEPKRPWTLALSQPAGSVGGGDPVLRPKCCRVAAKGLPVAHNGRAVEPRRVGSLHPPRPLAWLRSGVGPARRALQGIAKRGWLGSTIFRGATRERRTPHPEESLPRARPALASEREPDPPFGDPLPSPPALGRRGRRHDTRRYMVQSDDTWWCMQSVKDLPTAGPQERSRGQPSLALRGHP